MSDLTLGLDLGSNSIGWALLNEQAGAIVAAGVRAFPEGVDRDTAGTEVPKAQARRIARAMRRQIARRARRRRNLRRALVAAGLLPDVALLPREDLRRQHWETDAFKQSDPYELRRRALLQPLTPHDLGRALLHLAQRRGFLSNRKTDRAQRKESSELLKEISALDAELAGRTLAQYFSDLRGDDPARFHLCRLRGRHTNRAMYLREFDALWAAQRPHHPTLLTDDLKATIANLIFFQRPLRPPSAGLVGACELEPRLPRCPRADRRAQRFRLYQEVNNLRVLDYSARAVARPLTPEERAALLTLLSRKKEVKFADIRKALFAQHENVFLNLEQGQRKALKGLPTDAALAGKKLVGPTWHKLPEELKDRIVAAIIDDEEERLRFLLTEGGLDADLAPRLLDNVDLEEGYAAYSLHAIKKILPHLERGLPLTNREPGAACALRAAGYLLPWEHVAERRPFLADPPRVTNPLVRQALFEVRKVVNAILREYVYRPGHTLADIHIEMAREVRGTAEDRRKRTWEMREREAARATAAERIRDAGFKPTRDAIERYLLWEEQGHECLYSGAVISLMQLLQGEADVDHILPYSRSLDNSRMNKVVAFRAENERKGDQTPYAWLAERHPDKYEQMLQRARRLPFRKQERLTQPEVRLDDFLARQLSDTSYITTQVRQYVECLGARVLCPKGQHTAELRHLWGLDTALAELANGPAWTGTDTSRPGEKNRADHRHHAVDAIVIALTNHKRLQQLAALRRWGRAPAAPDTLPLPWPDFRPAVLRTVGPMLVSHRVTRRVSGPLHEETIYGPTDTPREFVYRKPVETLTPAMIDDIRDETIRRIIAAHLRDKGVDLARGAKIPADAWRTCPRMPSGVPIKRVRLVKRDQTIRPIRHGSACVKPGSLHHLCLFELSTQNARPARDAVFTSMIDALARIKARSDVIQRRHPTEPNARFLMSLSRGEMVLLEHDGRTDLYVFETAPSTTAQMYFRHHTFAGKSSDKRGQVSKKPNTLKAEKVTVDPLGRLRRAHD
jgi:CRISPR-associated endonuclease Csn1